MRSPGVTVSVPENESDSAKDLSSNRRAIITRFAEIAGWAFCVGFIALLVFAFTLRGPTSTVEMVLVACSVAFVFITGMLCVGLFFIRELLAWRKNRWRFNLSELIVLTTLIAFALVVARFALFAD
jgi:hypothetical protein